MQDPHCPGNGPDRHALERARALLEAACDNLRRATGLELDPGLAASELRDEAKAAALCARVDAACRAPMGASESSLALKGVQALTGAAEALREAVKHEALEHVQEARAISAYQENN